MPDTATKRCSKCGQIKPLSEFRPRAGSADGRRADCRECARQRDRSYYAANREAALEHKRQYRIANTDIEREQDRRYYQANRETLRLKASRYRVGNQDAVRERLHERKIRLAEQVFGHYGMVCACCGATERLTIDHINGDGGEHRRKVFGRHARAAGGTKFYAWLVANGLPVGYQTLCRSCNQSKGRGERCRLDHGR